MIIRGVRHRENAALELVDCKYYTFHSICSFSSEKEDSYDPQNLVWHGILSEDEPVHSLTLCVSFHLWTVNSETICLRCHVATQTTVLDRVASI